MSTRPPSSISSSDAAARLWLLCGVAIALILGALVLYIRVPLSEVNSNRYIAVAFDKRAHLMAPARDPADPEYLVYGGSTVAFSVATQDMQDRLGTPVYNLGLQASLGLMPLTLYAPFLAADRHRLVVVVDPETIRSHANLTLPQCDLVFLEKRLAAVWQTPHCLLVVIWRQGQDIRYHLRPVDPAGSVYQRRNFNTSGDQVGHLGRPLLSGTRPVLALDIPPEVVAAFTDDLRALAQGLDILVVPPPASVSYCRKNRPALTALVAQVHQALDTSGSAPAPLICIDDALEYDGAWYYGEQGRAQYTRYLTDIIAGGRT